MTSNLPEPATGAYVLNRVFQFPTDSGPTLAIAFKVANASSLLSFYSILVNAMVGQLWAIVIIIGVYASLRQPPEAQSHNAVVASVGILNAKRPLEVSALSVNYLYKLKRKSPWSLLIWLVISILALLASVGFPSLVSRHMVLGHGAPVDSASIYVPRDSNVTSGLSIRINSLEVPSALRAVGSVQSTDNTIYSENVRIDDPVRLKDRPDLGDGEFTSRYGYRYQVKARDFGLTRYDGLALHVEGSCTTEYDWLVESTGNGADFESPVLDSYLPWKITGIDHHLHPLSLFDAPMPMAYFLYRDSPTDDGSHRNTSFAILISSVDRSSYTPSEDPFYLTRPRNYTGSSGQRYIVRKGRPVLSCWQSDTWKYNGQGLSVTRLSNGSNSLVDFPEALNTIFTRFLSVPKITTLGIRLGASALLSATGALGETFEAGSASIHADLTRLVLASYIATANTLADTTLFRSTNTRGLDIPDLLEDGQHEEVAHFVIYSKDVSALSLNVIIVVPIVAVVMFIIAYLMTSHPRFPWYVVQGYQATVLYSLLDEKLYGAESDPPEDAETGKANGSRTWRRGSIAWFEGPGTAGRHASVVSGADGRPTLVVVDSGGTGTPVPGILNRNGDTTQNSKGHDGTTEIKPV